MYLNTNYPVGIALIANMLALVCHIVQFVIYARYQNPNNWAKNIPAKYIMTFVSGADSILTAYYFIKTRHTILKKSILVIIVTIIINAVAIALNTVGDDNDPWATSDYVGAKFYAECGSLENSYSKLRCQLIDAVYIALIVSVVSWFIALFSRKAIPKEATSDIERPSMSASKRTSSNITVSEYNKQRNPKPPKQKPIITIIDEIEEKKEESIPVSKENTKVIITATKTRNNTRLTSMDTVVVKEVNKQIKNRSSTEKLPLTIHDKSIKPLKALDVLEEIPMKYGGRPSTLALEHLSSKKKTSTQKNEHMINPEESTVFTEEPESLYRGLSSSRIKQNKSLDL